jgi:N-methylhydantoinase B/oxoprolinase/acetone carboxylase alpha subunit
LRVGPESVGAEPGPACYGRGGTRPTVTDANVVLGRLNPEFLLGGALAIDARRSAAAIEDFIARPKGLSIKDAAAAILAVSNYNIAQAIRVVSTRKGLDPADYALVAYGGAGPLHAASVAIELGVAEILVPSGPGILCAFGVLTKDIAMDLSVSRILRDTDERFAARVREVFDELQTRARCQLAESGANLATLSFAHSVDARYFGQNFELPIGVELGDAALHEQVRARFHDAHQRIYGYAQEAGEVELVTFRLRASLAAARPRVSHRTAAEQGGHSCKPYGRRSVLFDEADRPVPCDVYDRSGLAPGHRVMGPAVIEQMDTTTIVPPGFVAAVDPIGNLRLSRGGSAALMASRRHARIEVVAGALEATTAEMCASLIRCAYSPNIKERADCSTALCDLKGRTLSITAHAPAHLGSTIKIAPAILERFPIDQLAPGDVFFANDPYIVGVTHLNDCTAAAPVFIDGKPVAFTIAVAHHSDVGGRVPGSEFGDSTSIFQEGIRLPPVRLVERGVRRNDLWELFLRNSRTPHFSAGDLLAQLAALERGRARLEELYGKYGLEATQAAIGQVLDATELRLRARVREVLRRGTFAAEDWLDDDGISDTPVRLAASVTVDDAGVLFDFSDCPAQLGSGKNVPLTHTLATLVYCLKAVVDPSLPNNEGAFRVIRIAASEGSIVNPRAPAAVSSRNLTSIVLADVLFGALGQAAPSRAISPSGAFQGTILAGGDAQRNRYFVNYENFAGGQGALPARDGDDAMHVSMTNTSNLPIEAMEMEFPLRVERYELVPDSGGAGRHRGGLGVCRDIRVLGDGVVLATRSARQRFAAKGLDGGAGGGVGSFVINPGSPSEKRLPGTGSEIPLRDGTLLRIVTSGGGGYGDPRDREDAEIAADTTAGKVSSKSAKEIYRW